MHIELNETGFEYPQLYDAVWDQNIELARELLEKGADVNLKELPLTEGSENLSPAGVACYLGDLKMLKLLLKYGADLSFKYKVFVIAVPHLFVALHIEDFYRRYVMIRFLLDNKCNIESKTEEGDTPLSILCNKLTDGDDGRLEELDLLLQYGANINTLNEDGETPLDIVNNFLEGAYFKSLKANSSCRDYYKCINRNAENLVKFLLENGALLGTNKWPGWVKKCYVAYKRFKLNY